MHTRRLVVSGALGCGKATSPPPTTLRSIEKRRKFLIIEVTHPLMPRCSPPSVRHVSRYDQLDTNYDSNDSLRCDGQRSGHQYDDIRNRLDSRTQKQRADRHRIGLEELDITRACGFLSPDSGELSGRRHRTSPPSPGRASGSRVRACEDARPNSHPHLHG